VRRIAASPEDGVTEELLTALTGQGWDATTWSMPVIRIECGIPVVAGSLRWSRSDR
jgi:hypothetical protein